jgi:hypothetical protein
MDPHPKNAGVEHRGIHHLRHSFITTLAERGIHERSAQHLAGHEDSRMTRTSTRTSRTRCSTPPAPPSRRPSHDLEDVMWSAHGHRVASAGVVAGRWSRVWEHGDGGQP